MTEDFTALCCRYRELGEQCRLLDSRVGYLRNRLQQLEQGDCFSSPLLYKATERQLARTLRQGHELAAARQLVASKIRRIASLLPQQRLRDIVEYRYIGLLPWPEISKLMGLELRWLMRLNRRITVQLSESLMQASSPSA